MIRSARAKKKYISFVQLALAPVSDWYSPEEGGDGGGGISDGGHAIFVMVNFEIEAASS